MNGIAKLTIGIAGAVCIIGIGVVLMLQPGKLKNVESKKTAETNKTTESSKTRESIFTKKGTGPLYWCTYEYQYLNNQFMPEDVWQKNIDWLAGNFKQYGYDMACTDGWIEGSTRLNENGYILSHNDSWTHDWKYWSNYLADRGMKLGVYYNPLWVSPTVIGNKNYKIAGTNYTVESITNPDDRFNGGQPSSLYWVDVTKPGAKEYIQGYVKYFKDMGVRFLRIDFLSWYETGEDKGRTIGKAHGTDNYDMALKWMEEAAGEDMELSLVMPNLNNNAQTELKYGDMVRINEDCGQGGWERFSNINRGIQNGYWSQFSNPFDGLIYWSQYFGKGKMIADADMLRLNTFSSDDEKISAVSLCAISGAPIDIADEYDTIGGDSWIYQNSEILDLNKQGFVGKPLKADVNDSENSEIWTGKLPDGSFVVGLFNREDTAEKRKIDFKSELGISNGAEVRDLWKHKDLGSMSSFEIELAPHSCSIIKLAAK